jgi:hypothetical protein
MEDKVQCQVCKEYFKLISPTHLKKHGLTFQEYKELYPEAKMVSNSVQAKRSKSLTGRKLSQETKYRCGNGSRGRVQSEAEIEKRRQSNILACTDDVKKQISDSIKETLADGSVVTRTNKTKAQRRFLICFFNEMRILEQAAYGNLIQCEICGEWRENITGLHLKSHDITLTEYKQRFPLAKLYAESYPKRISAGHQGITYDEWESFAVGQEYCPKFDEACRESNRDKYGRRCFICDLPEEENITSTGTFKKLNVHHVDMNKNQGCDGIRWKLIPLCMKCHKPSHMKIWETRIEYLLNNVWL